MASQVAQVAADCVGFSCREIYCFCGIQPTVCNLTAYGLQPKAGQCPQPNFVVNFVVNFVDKVDDNVDDEDAQFLFFITVRDG